MLEKMCRVLREIAEMSRAIYQEKKKRGPEGGSLMQKAQDGFKKRQRLEERS